MLGQRRRRWTIIITALGQCLLFADIDMDVYIDMDPLEFQGCTTL